MLVAGDIHVSFEHGTESKGKRFTKCFVSRKIDEDHFELLAIGVAVCSKKDRFSKAEGRKLSMTRALQKAFPDNKKIRSHIWSAYQAKTSKL